MRPSYACTMRWRVALLAVLSAAQGVALFATPVIGQDRATDTELFAAYCQGVAEQWSRPPQAAEPNRLLEERLSKEQAERVHRLNAYLSYRLSGRSAEVRAAADQARQYGIHDARRCGGPNVRPVAKGVHESCASKCSDLQSGECTSCFKEAGEAAECRMADRCLGSSLLPY